MKFAPGTFIQGATGRGSAAALASPAPVAPATSAPSRKMRRLRIPLPAAGSTVGRVLFRFIEGPPLHGPAGEKLIYVEATSQLFCTNVRPNRAGRTTVGAWWAEPAKRAAGTLDPQKPQSSIGGIERNTVTQ